MEKSKDPIMYVHKSYKNSPKNLWKAIFIGALLTALAIAAIIGAGYLASKLM